MHEVSSPNGQARRALVISALYYYDRQKYENCPGWSYEKQGVPLLREVPLLENLRYVTMLQYWIRQLPIGAGHCQWDIHLTFNFYGFI